MAVISLKCPNCDGELVFEPSAQQYECPYCGSHFTQEQIDQMEQMKPQEQPSQENGMADFGGEEGGPAGGAADSMKNRADEPREADEESTGESAAVYTCPSCGAEIVTDATTAATFCYYCHNPVVLSGRISGKYLPKWIIPFGIDRKKAESMFLENVGKKKFVPKGFFDSKQIEKLTGVYFPYWIVDWKGQGRMQARATKVRIWSSGETEYTETRYYEVLREGSMEFSQLSRNALKKANKILVEGVQPYKQEGAKPFSMGYLSGFQAEKRDMEQQDFEQELQNEVKKYASKLLLESASGYTSVTPQNTDIRMDAEDWEYVLVPAWVLTYKGNDGKLYYYAINGQTGKVCGELPIAKPKLAVVSAVISAAVFALALLGGFLL
jgi:DNA-directed RNA polymerase subunit RPC12/RpoP